MSQSAATVPALAIRRVYDAPRERVYAAWTDPHLAAQFLGPGDMRVSAVEMDVRAGGKFRIMMQHPDGADWGVGGTYREVVPPQRLSMTWTWEEDDPKDEHESLLTIEFFDRDGKTELVLTHEYLASVESRDRHAGGWNAILDQLPKALS
jgi:uncharacterized protein YndB with AHSA1/START domain